MVLSPIFSQNVDHLYLLGRTSTLSLARKEKDVKDLDRIVKENGSPPLKILAPPSDNFCQIYEGLDLLCITADSSAINHEYIDHCKKNKVPVDRAVLARNNLSWLIPLGKDIKPYIHNGMRVHIVSNESYILAHWLTRITSTPEQVTAERITASSHVDYNRMKYFISTALEEEIPNKDYKGIDVKGCVLGTHIDPWPIPTELAILYEDDEPYFIDPSIIDKNFLSNEIRIDALKQLDLLVWVAEEQAKQQQLTKEAKEVILEEAYSPTVRETGRAVAQEILALLGEGYANMGYYDRSLDKDDELPVHMAWPVRNNNGKIEIYGDLLYRVNESGKPESILNDKDIKEINKSKKNLEQKIGETNPGIINEAQKLSTQIVVVGIDGEKKFLGCYEEVNNHLNGGTFQMEELPRRVRALSGGRFVLLYNGKVEIRSLQSPGSQGQIFELQKKYAKGGIESALVYKDILFAAHTEAGIFSWNIGTGEERVIRQEGARGLVFAFVKGEPAIFFADGSIAYVYYPNSGQKPTVLGGLNKRIKNVCLPFQERKIYYIGKDCSLLSVDLDELPITARPKDFHPADDVTAVATGTFNNHPHLFFGGLRKVWLYDCAEEKFRSLHHKLPLEDKINDIFVKGEKIYGVTGFNGRCYVWDIRIGTYEEVPFVKSMEQPLSMAFFRR